MQIAFGFHRRFTEVELDLITYFEGMQAEFAANYAEHALIEGKPRLQSVGDALDSLRWQLMFHSGFCDPERELLKLKDAIAAHKALPLVFAGGDYKGWFVPTRLAVTARQTQADGAATWIEAQLTLREYAVPKVLSEQVQRQAPKAVSGAAGAQRRAPPARAVDVPVTRGEARALGAT